MAAERDRPGSVGSVEAWQRFLAAVAEASVAVCGATVRAAGTLVSAAVRNYQSGMDSALRYFPPRDPDARGESPDSETRLRVVRGRTASTPTGPGREQAEGPAAATVPAGTDAAGTVPAGTVPAGTVPAPTTEEAWHADGAADTDTTIGEPTATTPAVHDAPEEAPVRTEATPDDVSPDPAGMSTGAPGKSATASEPAGLDQPVRDSPEAAAGRAAEALPEAAASRDDAATPSVTVAEASYAIRPGENTGSWTVATAEGRPIGTVHRRTSSTGRSMIWEARTMDDLPIGARAHGSRKKAATALAEHHRAHPEHMAGEE